MYNVLFSIILLLICSTTLLAQSPQGWLIYFGNTKIGNSKFSIHHEAQLRDYKLIGDHQQSLLRLGLQYAVSSKVNFTAGYGFIHTEAEGSPNFPFDEHRIYQEAIISHQLSRFRFRHRFRLEERFFNDRDFRGRGRYSLFMDVPLNQESMNKGAFYASFYDEVFLNTFSKEADTFDRNRLYGGFGYKFRQNLGLQLGYMRQHVGVNSGTNHALLSFHHHLKTK